MRVLRMLFAATAVLAVAGITSTRAEDAPKAAKAEKMDITATLEANERRIQESFKAHDPATFYSLADEKVWAIDMSGLMQVSTAAEMMKDIEVRSYTMDDFKSLMIG